METRYIIPATVAASLHLIVLFGFNPPHVPVFPTPPERTDPPTRIPVDLDDPPEPPPDAERSTTAPKGTPKAFRPGLPEPESKIADITIPLPPATPRPVDVTPVIVPGIPGLPNGTDEAWSDKPVVNFTALDNPPRTRSQVAPAYPAELRSAGTTGEVVVAFLVDETGRVSRAHVVRSTDARFEAATLRAIERWRFEPGKKSGRPVRFRMEVPVVFSLAG